MKTEQHTSHQCPSVEDLSSWFDQENGDENIRNHVADCKICQDCIEDFESIKDSIECNIKVDDEMILRISEKCLSEISKISPIKEKTAFPLWLKIAACFVFVGFIFTVKNQGGNSSRDLAKNEVIENNSRIKQQGTSIVQNGSESIKGPGLTFATSKGRNLRTTNVSMNNLSSLSSQHQTGSISGRSLDFGDVGLMRWVPLETNQFTPENWNETNTGNAEGLEIGDKIHHTWMVEDPTIPLTTLKNLLRSHEQAFEDLIQQKKDKYQVSFNIEDKDLRILTNHLSGIGCKLLDKDNSQLDLIQNAEFSGKIVNYQVEIIRQ